MPKMAVCCAVYNGAEYFDRAIPSILAQTLTDFEFVLYDDCSTDGTAERLEELAKTDPRIIYLRTDGERRGLARAMDHCVRNSTAPYCCRQDFDDTSDPRRLELQYRAFEENPDVGVVGGAYRVVQQVRGEDFIRHPPTDHDALVRRMTKAVPFAYTLTAFRRQTWEDIGGFPTVQNLTEMWFFLEVLKTRKWRFMAVPEVIGTHYVHGESFFNKSFKYQQRQKDLSRVQWEILRAANLPLWMGIYPLARKIYPNLPSPLKKLARRAVGFKESDV